MAAKSSSAKKSANSQSNGGNLGFEAQLWAAADKLRGNMEPSDYKHVALGLIFLKYISDAFDAKYVELAMDKYADSEDPEEYQADNVFWVPKEARWSHLQNSAGQTTIGKDIDVLQIAAFACCGGQWPTLRQWYKDNEASLKVPGVAKVRWNFRLLYRLFDCWLRLFRLQGRDDLSRIKNIIAGLRNDQERFEKDCLEHKDGMGDRSMAFLLIALYHWARATEIVADYMLHGEPTDPLDLLDKHFKYSIKAAMFSHNRHHEMALRWLHPTARLTVKEYFSDTDMVGKPQ